MSLASIFFLCLTNSYPIANSLIRSSIYYIPTSTLSICNRTTSRDHIPIIFDFRLDPSPRDVRVVRINDTAIEVFWSPVYYPPVERYLVHYNDKSENKPESKWSFYSPANVATTSAIISGLTPSAMYNVRVSAEFANTNGNETMRREGELSEIHVADIYRRK